MGEKNIDKNQIIIQQLKDSESYVPHMYCDTTGNVTIGIGKKLNDVNHAKKFGFINTKTGKTATADEIKKDFETVKGNCKSNYKAKAYKKHTQLILSKGTIENQIKKDVDEFERQLNQKIKNFKTLPPEVQQALIDMSFNVGTNGMVTRFPNLMKAINKKDWNKAAKESNRSDVSTDRNSYVRNLFLKASKRKAK
jgi:GH24 family phage-related lysozyme (muramidase)